MAMPMAPGAAPGLTPQGSPHGSVRERILAAQVDVCAAFKERTEVVRVITVALLAETNALLLGLPGTAKSAVLRAMSAHITGIKYAERLMSKFTTDNDLVGPPKVSALRDRDEYIRNMAGTPGDADIFFCDEVFRASGAALDKLLGLVNEHIVDGAPVPLRVCVGASNMGADQDYLQAIDDRFLLRVMVDPISDSGNFDALLTSGADASKHSYVPKQNLCWSKSEWEAARADVCKVGLPPHVRAELKKLWEKARLAKIYISDRRWKALMRVLQACAWLDGCAEIEPDHLDILRHGLWLKIQDRETVKTWIDTLDSGEVKAMVDAGDKFIRACADWSKGSTDVRNNGASVIMATQKALKADLAAKLGKGTKRTRDKALEVWKRALEAYLPVRTNLCQQMCLPEAETFAKEASAKDMLA